MHELAIAEGVLAVVERHAAGRRVERIDLKVGHLRQVVPSALTFAFELVSKGGLAEDAELVVVQVPAVGECRSCGAWTPLPGFPLMCTSCGGLDVQVVEGEELLVDSLELAAGGSRPRTPEAPARPQEDETTTSGG